LTVAYLGLGSNIGNREENIRQALDLLQTGDLRMLRLSSLYETEPMGFQDQPWFLNQVAEFATDLTPLQVLRRIQDVEKTLGRKREIINGPRIIDVDIVLFGDVVMKTEELTVPHPRYRERRFVLEPLAELNLTLKDPETRETLEAMLDEVRGQIMRRRQ
jgi:2-amino-4-hydroxy-6-hydroxymethyldihydropteridine diphosphokinase